MKFRLREINVMSLNTRTVILITQFVRLAKVREGADLKMQQRDIVRRVFNYAVQTDNVELQILFRSLKKEMIKHINLSNLEQPSFQMYALDGNEHKGVAA